MRVAFHPEARTEYLNAVQYYAEQKSRIAENFVNVIESGISKLSEAPDRHKIIESPVRRFLVNRFPYAILYEIESDQVLIWAVMHCRRHPDYWKQRTKRNC